MFDISRNIRTMDLYDTENPFWDPTVTLLAVKSSNLPFLEYLRDNQESLAQKFSLEISGLWDPDTLLEACKKKNPLVLAAVYDSIGGTWKVPHRYNLIMYGSMDSFEYALREGCTFTLEDYWATKGNCFSSFTGRRGGAAAWHMKRARILNILFPRDSS